MTDTWVLSRDDEEIMQGTEAACMRRLHQLCTSSPDYAIRYEDMSLFGYKLVPITGLSEYPFVCRNNA